MSRKARKTRFHGSQPGRTQTRLYLFKRWPKAQNFRTCKVECCTCYLCSEMAGWLRCYREANLCQQKAGFPATQLVLHVMITFEPRHVEWSTERLRAEQTSSPDKYTIQAFLHVNAMVPFLLPCLYLFNGYVTQ